MHRLISHQRGVALIIVLLVVAIVSVVAAEMSGRLQLNLVRSSNIKDNNQAYWYALSAEQFATKTIALLKQESDPINSTQPWAQEDILFPMENGGIEATLEDLQSCFNLNALRRGGNNVNNTAKQDEILAFQRLLETNDFNVPSLNVETVRDSLVDWLDEDSEIFGTYGAEDPDYESLLNPYLAANGFMVNKSELRLVKGVEPSWLTKIMPYVCVIPGEAELKININTFTPEKAPLLAALLGADLNDAQNIISNIPYADPPAFLQQQEVAALPLTSEQQKWFVTDTDYFILHVKSSYNEATFAMTSKFKVVSEQARVISREFGGKL